MENEKRYTVEELKCAMMSVLEGCAWETPVEEIAHYVRAYTQLIDYLLHVEDNGNE